MKEYVQFAKEAKQFEEQALKIIPVYDEFWQGILDGGTKKWTREMTLNKELTRKIAKKVLKFDHSPKVRLNIAHFLKPQREFIYMATVNILNKHNNPKLEKIKERYLSKVVHPMLEQWMNWLYQIAATDKFTPVKLPFNDKLSYAIIGFLKAIHKFDFESGKSISTLAHQWIHDTVSNGVFEEKGIAHVPFNIRVKATVEKDEKALNIISNVLNSKSLDDKLKDDSETIYEEIVAVDKSVNRSWKEKELREHIDYLLKKYLTNQEYTIIVYKFGLFDNEPLTDKEIRNKLGLSYTVMKNRVNTAFQKLSQVAELRDTLKEYVGG